MVLLTLFALVAGAATAVTPCVLPVLPALLSASATGGRRRPLGIVLGPRGHVHAHGRRARVARARAWASPATACSVLAEVVLIAFGLALIVPGVAARLEAPLARLSRFGPRSRGNGFWSGLGVGGGARLRLHALRRPDPRGGDLRERDAGHLGAARHGGGGLRRGLRRGAARCSRSAASGSGTASSAPAAAWRCSAPSGVVMIATAVAMATQLDVRFEGVLARQPARLRDRPDPRARALARRARPTRRPARQAPLRPR